MSKLVHRPSPRQTVLNGVLEQITRGDLRPGDKLLPTDQLAAHYHVSVPTAHKAVRELTERGYVRRQTGVGTFVEDRGDSRGEGRSAAQQVRRVGLLITSTGHLWDEVARILLVGLRDLEVAPVLVSLDDLDSDQVATLPAFRQLVAQQPAVVVTTGQGNAELVRRALPNCRIISLLTRAKVPVHRIAPDFYEVGRLCGEHLAQSGYSSADFLNVQAAPDLPRWQTEESRLEVDGLRDSLEAHGGRFGRLEILPFSPIDSPASNAAIRAYLQSADRAPALVCRFSHRAMQVRRQATALGLRIPEDLALISTLDTLWCRDFDLSAVDQRFQALAKVCVELIEQQFEHPTPIDHSSHHSIQPTLQARGSTARKDKVE